MSAGRFSLDLRKFPWTNRLSADYVYDYQKLEPFFSGNPANESSWHEALHYSADCQQPREAIADILFQQQTDRDTPKAARIAVETLRDPRTVAVVTGQQAGLFGGPLFTLLKAITALKLAEQTSERFKVPVVSVFWIDAEDHDWDEIRHCGILDPNLQFHSVSLPNQLKANNTPASTMVLNNAIDKAIDELREHLEPNDSTTTILSQLRMAYKPGVSMTKAFAKWIESVFGSKGLIVFDSSDPSAKSLADKVFAHELKTSGRTVTLTQEAGNRIAQLGYKPQLNLQADRPALFYMDGVRLPIYNSGEGFRIGTDNRTSKSLIEELNKHPERFSANVALRPLVQDTLFPTIASVVGPSELSYFAQLREVYKDFGMRMPLILPRVTASIIDPAATRFLNKHNLSLECLKPRDEATLNKLLESEIPASVTLSIDRAHQSARDSFDAVISAVPKLDPTLEASARSTLERIERDIKTFQGKVIKAAKRKNETLQRQFTRTQTQIFPNGKLQERELGMVFFLNRYGSTLVDDLSSNIELKLGVHWLLTL